MKRMARWVLALTMTPLLGGCLTTINKRTDRYVYDAIASGQSAMLGVTTNAQVQTQPGDREAVKGMYDFVPRPIGSEVPESFQPPPTDETSIEGSVEDAPAEDTPEKPIESPPEEDQSVPTGISPEIFPDADPSTILRLGLRDVLAYAMRSARDVQDEKEDLYLAALDLTLERHLWTPQFVASVQADYTNLGQESGFEQSLSTVSQVAVTQRLPLGGEVSARIISNLVRDLSEHVSTGESGNVILAANIPLFRNAGRVAYESRYQAERRLIYAVRTYESFRRSFAVRVAGQYFSLQQREAAIANAYKSYRTRKNDWERADFINQMGRSNSVFDAPRARSSFRQAESVLVSAKEAYASALDRFKIVIGMPVDERLEVLDQESDTESAAIEHMLTEVGEDEAIDVALRYRLDLLTGADRVDDAHRGVRIAKNDILPDLNLGGSVSLNSNPERLKATSFNTDRTTWAASMTFNMDDRKRERNAYRATLVAVRRAERDYDRFEDTVRADVRRAIRRINQQKNLLQIQAFNVEENELRYQAANAQFDLGLISNQDVVDADTDLLRARDDFAAAMAAYRNAILEYRRDTGTLRIRDDGRWGTPEPSTMPTPEAGG